MFEGTATDIVPFADSSQKKVSLKKMFLSLQEGSLTYNCNTVVCVSHGNEISQVVWVVILMIFIKGFSFLD